jgi:hypothetical protein
VTMMQNRGAMDRNTGRKSRRAPKDVPDSLPEREEGTDVAPDEVRDPDPPRRDPPDSLPRNGEDTTRP